jgi:F-type H+-transporting ATPase subunit b
MPQLDPNVFVPQLVWLAISFVILYLLLARVALPRIGDALEARQDRIAHDLDAASALRTEAEAVLHAYESAMAEARSKAQSEIAGAAEQRAKESAARQAELDGRIATQLAEAEKSIAAARGEALASVDALAAEIARAATERLIGGTLDEAAVAAAVGAAKGET